MSLRDEIALIQEAVDSIPGAADQFYALAEGLLRGATVGRRAYKATHWGNQGRRGAEVGSIPDPSGGVIELGRLAEITYLTRKGRDRQTIAYCHRFGEGAVDPSGRDRGSWGAPQTMPVLSYTYDERPSGLVIVRSASEYTVTDDGIEG